MGEQQSFPTHAPLIIVLLFLLLIQLGFVSNSTCCFIVYMMRLSKKHFSSLNFFMSAWSIHLKYFRESHEYLLQYCSNHTSSSLVHTVGLVQVGNSQPCLGLVDGLKYMYLQILSVSHPWSNVYLLHRICKHFFLQSIVPPTKYCQVHCWKHCVRVP